MKSIIQTAKELIEEKDDFVPIKEIIKELDSDNIENLEARVYTDLMSNGQFFYKDGAFSLTDKFTVEEIQKIKSEFIVNDINVELEELINKGHSKEADLVEDKIDDIVENEVDVDEFIDDTLDFDEEMDD